MESQVVLKREQAIAARSAARRSFPFRRWSRALALWWAADSMCARFEREGTRDLQLLHRHDLQLLHRHRDG
jgi:hypothetical protein